MFVCFQFPFQFQFIVDISPIHLQYFISRKARSFNSVKDSHGVLLIFIIISGLVLVFSKNSPRTLWRNKKRDDIWKGITCLVWPAGIFPINSAKRVTPVSAVSAIRASDHVLWRRGRWRTWSWFQATFTPTSTNFYFKINWWKLQSHSGKKRRW